MAIFRGVIIKSNLCFYLISTHTRTKQIKRQEEETEEIDLFGIGGYFVRNGTMPYKSNK